MRRRCSILAAIALSAPLLATPAIAEPALAATATPPSNTSTAPDPVDVAKAEAKRTGKEVEIPSLHTENMTTVAMPGGKTVRTYVSSTVVRVHRDGAWHKVDPTLVVENGVVKPRMTKLDIALSNGGSTPPAHRQGRLPRNQEGPAR